MSQVKHFGLTEEEIQKYIKDVISGNVADFESSMEKMAAMELRDAFAEKEQLEKAVAHHEQAAAQARAALEQKAGAIGVLSTMLYKTEGARRLKAASALKTDSALNGVESANA